MSTANKQPAVKLDLSKDHQGVKNILEEKVSWKKHNKKDLQFTISQLIACIKEYQATEQENLELITQLTCLVEERDNEILKLQKEMAYRLVEEKHQYEKQITALQSLIGFVDILTKEN